LLFDPFFGKNFHLARHIKSHSDTFIIQGKELDRELGFAVCGRPGTQAPFAFAILSIPDSKEA
jgi:hypothetical protein